MPFGMPAPKRPGVRRSPRSSTSITVLGLGETALNDLDLAPVRLRLPMVRVIEEHFNRSYPIVPVARDGRNDVVPEVELLVAYVAPSPKATRPLIASCHNNRV